jgi:hypothetical protein
MKKILLLLIILPLLYMGAKAQNMQEDSSYRFYKITDAYHLYNDSTHNVSDFFKNGFIMQVVGDSSSALLLEKDLEEYLTVGSIQEIEKPKYANMENARYYKYPFKSKLYEDSKPAYVARKKIKGSYKEYGVWHYIWAFIFADNSELNVYTYKLTFDRMNEIMKKDSIID